MSNPDPEQPEIPQEPPSRDDLLRIAAEVEEGKRPKSDLAKYGISFGETIEGEEARRHLIAELRALGAWDDEDDEPDTAAGDGARDDADEHGSGKQ